MLVHGYDHIHVSVHVTLIPVKLRLKHTCFLRRVWINILLSASLIVSSWVFRLVSESKFSISRFSTFEYLPLIPQNKMNVASTWQLEMTRIRIFFPISVIFSSSALAIVPVGSMIASSLNRKLEFEASIGIAFGSNWTHSLKTIEVSTKTSLSFCNQLIEADLSLLTCRVWRWNFERFHDSCRNHISSYRRTLNSTAYIPINGTYEASLF